MDTTRIFGPVPSRRLGKSIGINHIPPKICTYSCVYCQLGNALRAASDRHTYYDPNDLLTEAKEKIKHAELNHEPIDYLTLVPDGEPTLDKNLGTLMDLLKPLGFKTAVITNSSLLNLPEVREDLSKADWVSVKIDTADEKIWRKINRPHQTIALDSILSGITEFSKQYKGRLVTETMLVKDLNDGMETVFRLAEFIQTIQPDTAYLSIPTRPPAQKWAKPPKEPEINRAYQIFRDQSLTAEYLIGYEGNEFAYTGNIEEDILSITSVHPMREEAVRQYLKKANSDFSIIENMLRENKIVVSEYNNTRFYLRKLVRNTSEKYSPVK